MGLKSICAALAVIVLALGASAAAAAPTSGQPQARSNGNANDGSRRVCRSQVPVGTRLAVRTCRTAAEWENEARRTSQDVENQQRDSIREPEMPKP